MSLALALLGAFAAAPAEARLRVSGNNLVDNGRVVQLLGVNRSGTEYMCKEGFGNVFDGPSDQASIDAMKTWHVNTVRVPLNESCWLGVGKLRRHMRAYRRAIILYIRRLRRNGLYVIIDSHYSAPGRRIARDFLSMPTVTTAKFWRSVARRYRRSNGVLFDLYNEPHDVSWRCWLHGCRVSRRRAPPSNRLYPAYRSVGMRRLLREVRKVGARQIVLIGGLKFSRDLSRWLRWKPRDPARQLVASIHTYGPATARLAAVCFGQCRADLVEIRRRGFPVVAGEIGQYDCRHEYIDDFMNFADANGISYLGWAWDAVAPGGWQCDTGPALITDYNGTAYGVGLRNRILARRP
jgi:hypothetical protein